METGAFGWGFQDKIQPILDEYDRQIETIRRNGAEGQLARMQAGDDAMANSGARGSETPDIPYGVMRRPDPAAFFASDPGPGALGLPLSNYDGSQFSNAGIQFGAGNSSFGSPPNIPQLGPGEPSGAVMSSGRFVPQAALNLSSATQGPGNGNVEANGGILGALHDIYRGAADAITRPEVTDIIKRQSEYVRRAGDTVGLGGTGLAVAGTVTAQPELIAPGVAGMGLGEALSALGSAGVALSDALANDRKAAIRDSIGGLVGSKLPYTIDPQKSVIDRTAGYFGF